MQFTDRSMEEIQEVFGDLEINYSRIRNDYRIKYSFHWKMEIFWHTIEILNQQDGKFTNKLELAVRFGKVLMI